MQENKLEKDALKDFTSRLSEVEHSLNMTMFGLKQPKASASQMLNGDDIGGMDETTSGVSTKMELLYKRVSDVETM